MVSLVGWMDGWLWDGIWASQRGRLYREGGGVSVGREEGRREAETRRVFEFFRRVGGGDVVWWGGGVVVLGTKNT